MTGSGLSDKPADWRRAGGKVINWGSFWSSHSAGCLLDNDVGSQMFTEIGDLVHEGDAGGEHGVGRIFSHFGTFDVHDDDPVILAHERFVEFLHQFGGSNVVRTDDNLSHG